MSPELEIKWMKFVILGWHLIPAVELMLLHLKFFFMVIAFCVIISYTKWGKIATDIKFFELIYGSSIVHSFKIDPNFTSRLGRWLLLARWTGFHFIIRELPIFQYWLGIYQLYLKSVFNSTFAASLVSICWQQSWKFQIQWLMKICSSPVWSLSMCQSLALVWLIHDTSWSYH